MYKKYPKNIYLGYLIDVHTCLLLSKVTLNNLDIIEMITVKE